MAWKLVEFPKTVKITRKLAQEYALMERAPHDRELQPRRLDHINRIINENRLRPPEWVSAYCLATSTLYRINGKHTSTVISGLNKIPDHLKAITSKYECATLEDVADLYATFDAKFTSRSARDIYTVFGQSHPALTDVQTHVLALCAAGITYGIHESGKGRVPVEERARKLLENPEFVLFVASLNIRAAEFRWLARSAVVAAMYKVWMKSKTGCVSFWKSVRDGDDPDPQSASRVLQRWLMTTSLSSKNSVHTETNRSTDHEMLSRCILAYNSWRKGKALETRYQSDKPTPEVA